MILCQPAVLTDQVVGANYELIKKSVDSAKECLKIFNASNLPASRALNRLCWKNVSHLSLLQRTTESDVNKNINTRDGGSIFHLELH